MSLSQRDIVLLGFDIISFTSYKFFFVNFSYLFTNIFFYGYLSFLNIFRNEKNLLMTCI
jgi:hypothetical protein